MKSILLIDDAPAVLGDLEARLRHTLSEDEGAIRTWAPTGAQGDPLQAFNALVDPDTILVVTDYDLTAQGRTGLFGASVVAWCQARAIPVGDYSRAMRNELPKEPNFFELRVPKDAERAAVYISAVFRGFSWIRQQIATQPDLLTKQSPPAVIAALLDTPSLESQFALYGVRLGATSAALVERIVHVAEAEGEQITDQKRLLLGYIVGHVLLNAILRFPGPILSGAELTAYVGANQSEADNLVEIFAGAAYSGPFSELNEYFWLSKIDEILHPMIDSVIAGQQLESETHGELNRVALEGRLGRALERHACGRCAGKNGGFWCPFTRRAVCQRQDCSVGANSWIPQGARLCRIERDFYDEWAPILGI